MTLFYGCDNNRNDAKYEPESNSNTIPKIKSLNSRQLLGLKGDVEILKQEEFLASEPNQEIGYKTGENSFVYKFDLRGEKIGESLLDKDGLIKGTSTFDYDDKGVKVGKVMKDVEGEIISINKYEHDQFGRITKISTTEPQNELEYYSLSNYDDDGSELLYATYATDGTKAASAEYEYANGAMVKMVLKDNFDSPTAISEYSNNEFGDVIAETYYTGNNLLFAKYHCEYTYDDHHNWIVKKYFLSEKIMNSVSNSKLKEGIQTITMRTITYR